VITQSDKTSARILNLGIALLSIAFLLISLGSSSSLWGGASWRVLGLPLASAGTAIIVLAALPRVSEKIGASISSLENGCSAKAAAVGLALTMVVFLAILSLLASENHLLGDGFTVLSNVQAGKMSSPTEPLTYLFNSLLYRFFGGHNQSALPVFRVGAGLAGLLFCFGIYRLSRDKRDGFLILASVLSFGIIQFFAGYVENYSYAFVLCFLYFLSASDDLLKNRVGVWSIVLLVCAIGFHLSSAVFVPALAYQFYQKMESRSAKITVVVATATAAVAGLSYLAWTGLLGQIFVPLWATSENPYHLFSSQHLADLLNILLRNTPLLLPLALTYWVRALPQRNLLLMGLVPALIFMIAVDPKIGAVRDWDLLSIACAPAMVMMILSVRHLLKGDRRLAYSLFLPFAIFGILHTGSWVYLNSHRDSSYQFVKQVMKNDVHNSTDYYGGYRLVPWFVLTGSVYRDSAESKQALRKYIAKHPDDQYRNYLLAGTESTSGHKAEAARLLRNNWQRLVSDPEVIMDIARMFGEANWSSDEEAVLEAIVKAHGYQMRPTYALGMAKRQRGQLDSAWTLMTYAISRADSLSEKHVLDYALFSLELNKREEARVALLGLATNPRTSELDRIRQLIDALDRNDSTRAMALQRELRETIR
jgi:hypothetical protein